MKVVILLALALALAIGVSSEHCPSNEAFQHDGFYYQFFDCLLNWDDAEYACQNQMVVKGRKVVGGHLVSILKKAEVDWLKFMLEVRYGGAKYGFWIGAKHQPGSPNSCPEPTSWVDGNRFTFKNFEKSPEHQPNCQQGSGENCIHIYLDNNEWNDAQCQVPMRFICKAKLIDQGGK